jgi:hypothetical protein
VGEGGSRVKKGAEVITIEGGAEADKSHTENEREQRERRRS